VAGERLERGITFERGVALVRFNRAIRAGPREATAGDRTAAARLLGIGKTTL